MKKVTELISIFIAQVVNSGPVQTCPRSGGGAPIDPNANPRYPACWLTATAGYYCIEELVFTPPASIQIQVGSTQTNVLQFGLYAYWDGTPSRIFPIAGQKTCGGNSFTYTATVSPSLSLFTFNTATKDFNIQASSPGTYTISVTATALDYANMDPPPDATKTGDLFITQPITFVAVDPCVSPTKTSLIAPTIANNNIQFGATTFKVIATVFFDDTIGSGKAPNFCGTRTYSIQSQNPLSASFPLSNTQLLIDPVTGVVTAQTNTVATIGTHTIVIHADMTLSDGSLLNCPQQFILEVQCVLTSLTMASVPSQYYEVLTKLDNSQNTQTQWTYALTGIVQTPACNWPLTVTVQIPPLLSTFLSATQGATNEVFTIGMTSDRSLCSSTPYTITMTAQTPPYTYVPSVPQSTQLTTMSVTVLDPCRRTTLNSLSIQNITSFERQTVTSSLTYTFTDTIEIQSGIQDYCGLKQFSFSLSSFPSTELTGSNRGFLVYSPEPTSKYGTFKAQLTVSLDTATYVAGQPTLTVDEIFFVTNIGIIPTLVPNQCYTIGNDPLQIQFSAFSVFPATIDQTQWNTTSKFYWNKNNITLSPSPLISELNLLDELPTWAINTTQTSSSLEIVCYSTDRSVQGTFDIVVAKIFHTFSNLVKISTFKIVIKTVPEFIDIKKPFFTTPLQNQVVQQCPDNQTSDWSYYLPEVGTNAEPVQYVTSINILYIPAFIGYDAIQKMLYQIAFMSNPINTTVTFTLTTNMGKKSTLSMKISFLCNQSSSYFNSDSSNYGALLDKVGRQKTHPMAFISKIEFTGLVHISFNTSMKPPDHILDIQNSTLVINETTFPVMKVFVVPGKYSDSHMLKFNWTVVSYSPGKLLLQLNFDNPSYVSSNKDPDCLQIIMYGFYLFTDFRGNMMMPESLLTKKGLPLLTSPEAADQAAQIGASVQGAITGITMSSTLMTVLVAGPINQILDAVKALQITSHLMLINVQLPANSQIFFGLLMSILSLQFIPTSDYFTAWFKLDDDGNQPFNENFNNLGYNALYIIQNMGTILLAMIAPLIWYFVNLCLMYLWQSSSLNFRYEQIRNFLFYNGTFSFFNETFLVISFCCVISTFYFHWNTPGNILNSSLTLVFGAILIGFPILVYFYYTRPGVIESLLEGDEQQEKRYGELLKPFNLKRRGKQVVGYLGLSLLRRATLVLTIIFFLDHPVFSLVFVNFQGLIVTVASGYTEPFTSKVCNQMDLLNEAFVLIIMYQLFCCTEFVTDPEQKSIVGMILITVTCVHVGINLSVMAGCNLALVARKLKLKYLQQKQRSLMQQRQRTVIRQKKENFERKVQMILEFEERQKYLHLSNEQPTAKKKTELTQISEVSCESDDDEKLRKKLDFVPVKLKQNGIKDINLLTKPLNTRGKVLPLQNRPQQTPITSTIELFDSLGNIVITDTPHFFSVAQVIESQKFDKKEGPISQQQVESTFFDYRVPTINLRDEANFKISNMFGTLQSDQTILKEQNRIQNITDERAATIKRLEMEKIQNGPTKLSDQLLSPFWESDLPDQVSVYSQESKVTQKQRSSQLDYGISLDVPTKKKDLWSQFNDKMQAQRRQ